MLPDRVSNPGPLTYESGALPIALRGPALLQVRMRTFLRASDKHPGTEDNAKIIFLISQQKHML